ncbi:MAG: toprim domain-containing protein [Oscillospiraceae bacterium]
MIRIKQAIIVEGRYDKNTLSQLVDALIITTDGFGIYKDAEKLELIRSLARKTGVIILTDSDSAGNKIRSYLRGAINEGEVINVVIPDIRGKERRKREPSKQGLLGVEGMSRKILLSAFEKSGVLAESAAPREPITRADLMEAGLIGAENSAQRRKELQQRLGLPAILSVSLLTELLNTMYSREEFFEIV